MGMAICTFVHLRPLGASKIRKWGKKIQKTQFKTKCSLGFFLVFVYVLSGQKKHSLIRFLQVIGKVSLDLLVYSK
jgi:hypothetical protein